jgi:hypothetical protein
MALLAGQKRRLVFLHVYLEEIDPRLAELSEPLSRQGA